MKKVALYILFVLCFKSSTAFTQDSIATKKNSKFLYGVNFSQSLSHEFGFGLNFSAMVTSTTKFRHSLYVGPMLNSPGNGDVWGFQGGYLFFPNPKQKRFDFHFFYDVKYMRYDTEESFWQHMIGNGFRFNLLSKLYLNNNIGIGMTNEKTKNIIGILEQHDYLSWLFTVGIGYNF